MRFAPGLRILGADAFSGCTSLRRADVPASCTRIGPGAFDDCPLAPETHAESAELDSHAESAEGAELDSHAESAEGAELDSHAESAEGAEN